MNCQKGKENSGFAFFQYIFPNPLETRLLHMLFCIFKISFNSIYLWLYSPCGPWPLFQFLNLHTVGRTPWTGNQSVTRPPLPTYRTTQIQNKRIQTSMPWVGFEPIIPVFERAKTVHALDRAATMIGSFGSNTDTQKRMNFKTRILPVRLTYPCTFEILSMKHKLSSVEEYSRTVD
jgi:hypothetical protein